MYNSSDNHCEMNDDILYYPKKTGFTIKFSKQHISVIIQVHY